MAEIIGKTVYVLGAGASCHTGAPLLADFLVKARLLFEGKRELKYKKSFERVFKWIEGLRGSAYYVDFDLDNIEHIFSLADMSKQLSLENGEQLFSDLRYIIMETLDTCQINFTGEYFTPDDTYRNFALRLTELNQQRSNIANQYNNLFERDTIISFNYDVMLDYAFESERLGIDYNINSNTKHNTEGFHVLKLHGSTNWAKCINCNNSLQIIPPYPPNPSSYSLYKGEKTRKFPFRIVTDVLSLTECDNCKKKDVLEPFLIPPTWSKAVKETPIANVWATAVNKIKSAFQIIVIGYSLPPTDTFFQYLMTLGLSENSNLHRVVIVNKDDSEEFQKRYERVFSRSLKDRGRLKYLTGKTFIDFVREDVKSIGSEI